MRDKHKILRAAEKYVLDQKFSAAIGEYRKLLEVEPDEPTLLNIVGDLLVRQGKPQEALKNFQKVVEIFLNRGFASKAIAMLKKTLWIAPQDMLARESLADLYHKQGLQFDAVRELRYLVDHYEEANNVDRALHFLKRIATIAPTDPEIPLRKAELLSSQGRDAAALEARIEALECLRKNGDFPAFKATLGPILRSDPENGTALDLLRQIGEGCHAEKEVREILAAHLESGAPAYPVKLYLARAEESVSNPKAAARLYKELRQAGHSDTEITDGLMRTDPESAYASSDAIFDEEMPLHPDGQLAAQADWEPPSADEDGASGSGLFADLESDEEDFQSASEEEQSFSFEDSEEIVLTEPETDTADLSNELDQIQPDVSEESSPIASLDEALQEVDFYLKLGFKEDGVSLIERLLKQFPDDEAVQARARRCGIDSGETTAQKVETDSVEPEETVETYNVIAEEDKLVSAFPDAELFEDFDKEMEDALDDLFAEGQNGDREDSILRYDVSQGTAGRRNSPAVHYDLGLAYKEMGLVDDAHQEFLIAIDMLDGDSAIPQKILCCSMLTSTCRQLGKTADAIHWAREGLKITELRDFEKRAFEYDRSLALAEKGELQEAIDLLQDIQDRDSSYRDVNEKLSHFISRLHG